MKKVYAPFVSTRLGFRLVLLALAAALTVAMATSPALAQLSQESEQEGESGEVEQSGDVTGSGDNSNQCVGIQGVANTGNAQNQISIEQYESDADDFEFDEVGSSVEVNPESSTECTQEVNQAAAASADTGHCTWYGWWCYWSTDYSLWYWDGYYWWGPYASWTAASNVTAGALDTAANLTTLGVIGSLALAGTAALLIRRTRRG